MKIPLLAGALMLALQFAAGDCANCVPGKRRAELCEPHASEEQAALKACVVALRADEPEVRIVALRELAALTEVHTNAPSPLLVKTLARGLKDDSIAVQLETVKLLGGQHPEAVLTALVPFVKAHMKCVEETIEQQEELIHDQETRALNNHESSWSKRTRADDKKDRVEQQAVEEELAALLAITDALAVNLGQYQDARSISALEALAETGSRPELANALASLGNVEAAELLMGRLPAAVMWWELAQSSVEIALLALEVNVSLEEMEVGPLKEAAENKRQRVETLHTALEQIARAAGHEQDLPEMGPEVDEQWKAG